MSDFNPLGVAQCYARRGWPVFPCKQCEKRPATRNGFKAGTTDAKRVSSLWRNRSESNIGICTGAASGLVAVDVDPRHRGDDTLAKLETEYGELPPTLTSLTGGGGRHLLFKHPGGKVKCRSHALGHGLDIKGDGGYIIAPPSIHPNGGCYAWADGLDPDSVEVAELPGWLKDSLADSPASLQTDVEEREIQQPSTSQRIELSNTAGGRDCCRSCMSETLDDCSPESLDICSSVPLCHSIEDAIGLTLPDSLGQRNRAVFEFTRALKSMPSLTEIKLSELKGHVRQWHDASASVTSGEHSFTDTWAEFLYAWPRIKHPRGTGPMVDLFAKADKAETPPIAVDYDDTTQRLVRLCRELQHNAGGKPFFLGYRTVADLMGIDRGKAGRLLNMLCVEGVIELTSKGHTGRASEYRYIEVDLP